MVVFWKKQIKKDRTELKTDFVLRNFLQQKEAEGQEQRFCLFTAEAAAATNCLSNHKK